MDPKKVNLIVIHCAATKETSDVTVEDINQMHLNRGFRKIGYHFYITKDGVRHEGRKLTEQGAHEKRHNKNSWGICYEGGLDDNMKPKDTRTPEQMESLCELLSELSVIPDSKPTVCGHRDLSPDLDGDGVVESHEFVKACPCFDAKEEYYYLNE